METQRFIATMPDVYERLYRPTEMTEHAAIVSRRGEKLIHAELWQSAKGPLLCVVAEDRPGLLALVTDALLAQGMAIQSARAFCRVVSKDKSEAVDFLELHALGGAAGAAGAAALLEGEGLPTFVDSLTSLVTDDLARSKSGAAPSSPPTARVYFERAPLAEGSYLLVVDAPDRDGLLYAVSNALHANGMRIVACEIRTVGGRALDRFEVESASPRPLNDSELCDVQLAVFAALPSWR
jgi:UTP:GlnB (protein PII) uridylyltransferase